MVYQVQPLPGYLQTAYSNDPQAGIANELTQQGMQSTPTSWAGGLARLAQTLVGSYKGNQIRQNYQNQAADYRTQLAQALSGSDPAKALSQSNNPQLQDMGLQFQMQRAAREPQVTYRPLSQQEIMQGGLDPRGSYQISSQGQISVLNQPKSPTLEHFRRGNQDVTGYIDPTDPNKIVELASGAAFAPQQPQQPTERERYARLGNLQPGTKEYQNFMLTGKMPGEDGAFGGNALQGQAWNVITDPKSDPNSPQYAAAWAIVAAPKTSVAPDGGVSSIQPDMSAFRRPGSVAQPTANQAGVTTQALPGAVVTQAQGTGQDPTMKNKLAEFRSESSALVDALNTFKGTVDNSTRGDALSAAAGGLTTGGSKLNTDWTNAALLAKGQALYNLGVLSGPDLDILRNAIADPSTFRGMFKSKESYDTAIDSVIDLLNKRSAAYEQNYGKHPVSGQQSPNTPAPGALVPPQAPDANLAAPAAPQGAATPPATPQAPVPNAKQAPDGNWYVPDPARPGKYLMVKP